MSPWLQVASSPGPFPALQCCMLKCGRAWYQKSNDFASRWLEDQRSRGRFEKPAFVGHAPTLQVYFLTLCSLKQLYYNRSIVSKPYLKQIVNGSTLNFADLCLAHVHLHPSTTLHTDKIGHVTSDTRLSHFSACNIEKLGMGLGTRLGCKHFLAFSTEQVHLLTSTNHFYKPHFSYLFSTLCDNLISTIYLIPSGSAEEEKARVWWGRWDF